MTQRGRYHGGLVTSQWDDTMLDRLARAAAATLEDYGHPVERHSVSSTQSARISASHYFIRLSLTSGKDTAPTAHDSVGPVYAKTAGALNPQQRRLQIDLHPVDPARDDEQISHMLMVIMLYRMMDLYPVEHLEWLDPKTVVSPEFFLAAFAQVPPSSLRGRQEIMDVADPRFAAKPETARPITVERIGGGRPYRDQIGLIDLTDEEELALALRSDGHPQQIELSETEAPSDIRRLAIWGMTGMTAFLCAPVAVSMAAVNLARGEDLRLNTHVLSLTGLLVMLQSTGALASVVSQLPL
ncbi:MAG: hypothetical protein AB8B51_01210 [Sedimentitalea sp.]